MSSDVDTVSTEHNTAEHNTEAPTLTAKMVGRGPELRELEECFNRVVTGETAEVVTVIGRPGLGKTRLISEFLRRIENGPHAVTIVRGACRENAPAFGVVQRMMQDRFDLPTGEPAAAKARFRRVVRETMDADPSSGFLHFLGAYVDLKFTQSDLVRAVERDATESASLARTVLRRWLEADAGKRPLVMVFEDLHWAGENFLALLRYLADSISSVPLMLVLAARPELLAQETGWAEAGSKHTRINLRPLNTDAAAGLIYKLLEPLGEDVPDALIDAAVDAAGGTPYLLEQMVRAYFDHGVLALDPEDASRWTVDLKALEVAVLPVSVEEAIRTRIDSLSPAERSLLEKASTLGGVFWLGALIALSRSETDTPDLWGGHESLIRYHEETLAALGTKGFVLRMPDSTLEGEQEYAFQHNLERELIHRLTPVSEAKRFHRVAAEWLEFHMPRRGEEKLEMLAHHYEKGGQSIRAAACYVEAGHHARRRFANKKATWFFERGLNLQKEDCHVPNRLETLHAYGDVLQLTGQYSEALAVFRRMLGVAYRLDLKAKGGVAHNRIGRCYRSIGRLNDAMRHLGTGQVLFEAGGDVRGVASSIDDIGKVHWMRASYEQAEHFMLRAQEMRRGFVDQELSGAKRSLALSYNNLGLVYQDSGRFAEAKAALEEALALRLSIEDRVGVAQTLNNLGTLHQDDGDHEAATVVFLKALHTTREVGDRMREAVVLTNLGESHYRMDRPEEAVAQLEEAEEVSRSLGDTLLEGEILRGLAKAHMLLRNDRKARDYIERSVALFQEARGRAFLAAALRTRGEIAASAGWGGSEFDRAKESFLESIAVFEELGNEIELAASLDAYAGWLEGTEEPPMHDVMELRSRSASIRDRLHAVTGSESN